MPYKSYRIDGAELYCKVEIYNHLSRNFHVVVVRLPHEYMDMQDIEKYTKRQVETAHISFIKVIGIGATVLGHRDSIDKY